MAIRVKVSFFVECACPGSVYTLEPRSPPSTLITQAQHKVKNSTSKVTRSLHPHAYACGAQKTKKQPNTPHNTVSVEWLT